MSMDKLMKKELLAYFKKVQHLLPYTEMQKRRYIQDFKDSVLDYCIQHPHAELHEIQEHFGTAEEISEILLSDTNTHIWKRSNQRIRFFRACLAVVLIAGITASSYSICKLWNQKNACEGHFVETIVHNTKHFPEK